MSKNDITGDEIKTKVGDTEKYGKGWDRIFKGTKQSPEEDRMDVIGQNGNVGYDQLELDLCPDQLKALEGEA